MRAGSNGVGVEQVEVRCWIWTAIMVAFFWCVYWFKVFFFLMATVSVVLFVRLELIVPTQTCLVFVL